MPEHRFRFQVTPQELWRNLEAYIDEFVAELQSFFEVMPKGTGFVSYEAFASAYETLLVRTSRFSAFTRETVLEAVRENSLVLVVLRTILGFSPPELARIATGAGKTAITQADARRIDQMARQGESLFKGRALKVAAVATALAEGAVTLIREGAPSVAENAVHRLDQVDTSQGLAGVARAARDGVPYPRLLYERLLGRPFASHRDSVSESVGDILENALAKALQARTIPYYRSTRAERFDDMDQAPDFFVPNFQEPSVLIEAKVAEDDGTARDKVTRVQHLAELRDRRQRQGLSLFDLVACVDGRGFGVRRGDVKKLLVATQGKVFTLATIGHIVSSTSLGRFARDGSV